jgi:hypothetical protein
VIPRQHSAANFDSWRCGCARDVELARIGLVRAVQRQRTASSRTIKDEANCNSPTTPSVWYSDTQTKGFHMFAVETHVLAADGPAAPGGAWLIVKPPEGYDSDADDAA